MGRVMMRAILFDLDDTLLIDDEARDAALVATGTAAHERYGVDPASLAQSVRERARALWPSGPVFAYCNDLGITYGEGLWGRFQGDDPNLAALRAWAPAYRLQAWSAALHDYHVDDAALARGLADLFMQERRTRHALFPEASAVLQLLRQSYRLALVTNGAADMQGEKIEAAGLAPTFDAIAVSGALGMGKPRPDIFAWALERLGVAATEAVMVGNDLGRDIAGARNAGLPGIWIKRGDMDPNSGAITPDATIKSLSELPALCATITG